MVLSWFSVVIGFGSVVETYEVLSWCYTNGFPTIYATSMTHGKVWTTPGRMLTASRFGLTIEGRLLRKLVVVFVDVPCLVSNVKEFGKKILASVEVALWALEKNALGSHSTGIGVKFLRMLLRIPLRKGHQFLVPLWWGLLL